VFQYMKMLDPGSTVREGEFANAENARGVPDAVMNIYNKVVNGEPLTAAQVADFKKQAGNLYNEGLTSYDKTRQTYEGIAQQYRFDPSRTVPDLATMRPDGQKFKGGVLSQLPPDAVAELLADPSPEAQREFDEVFGPGNSQRLLQERGYASQRMKF
jgi:hypothetical protein